MKLLYTIVSLVFCDFRSYKTTLNYSLLSVFVIVVHVKLPKRILKIVFWMRASWFRSLGHMGRPKEQAKQNALDSRDYHRVSSKAPPNPHEQSPPSLMAEQSLNKVVQAPSPRLCT